ncbi:hypothetical protein CYMTET_55433 [Cymbomonas tetramitiformis]|uniref:Uncharacterized protein n=1 Tax=Cymbomonas tetramitiformis TaxID=36881 RepID=A0AAE0END4_9CHLO|nr:hypothetical protein CYMTET_55433 [Cymbomonas tetramitiformis]
MESGNVNVNCSDRIFTELGTHFTELEDWLMAMFRRFSALQKESPAPGASVSSADAAARPDEEAGAEDVLSSDEEPMRP